MKQKKPYIYEILKKTGQGMEYQGNRMKVFFIDFRPFVP